MTIMMQSNICSNNWSTSPIVPGLFPGPSKASQKENFWQMPMMDFFYCVQSTFQKCHKTQKDGVQEEHIT